MTNALTPIQIVVQDPTNGLGYAGCNLINDGATLTIDSVRAVAKLGSATGVVHIGIQDWNQTATNSAFVEAMAINSTGVEDTSLAGSTTLSNGQEIVVYFSDTSAFATTNQLQCNCIREALMKTYVALLWLLCTSVALGVIVPQRGRGLFSASTAPSSPYSYDPDFTNTVVVLEYEANSQIHTNYAYNFTGNASNSLGVTWYNKIGGTKPHCYGNNAYASIPYNSEFTVSDGTNMKPLSLFHCMEYNTDTLPEDDHMGVNRQWKMWVSNGRLIFRIFGGNKLSKYLYTMVCD